MSEPKEGNSPPSAQPTDGTQARLSVSKPLLDALKSKWGWRYEVPARKGKPARLVEFRLAHELSDPDALHIYAVALHDHRPPLYKGKAYWPPEEIQRLWDSVPHPETWPHCPSFVAQRARDTETSKEDREKWRKIGDDALLSPRAKWSEDDEAKFLAERPESDSIAYGGRPTPTEGIEPLDPWWER